VLHLFPADHGRPQDSAFAATPVTAPARKSPAPSRRAASSSRQLPLRIAVEGPLRAGKSTLANLLAERMGATCLVEPENNPFLARFYAGDPGAAFATQMWFLRERLAQMAAAAALTGPVVSDYLFEKDKLFAYLNLSDAELATYRTFHAAHPVEGPRPDLVVYLQASPHVLNERRRRKGIAEEQGLSDEYTTQVCEAYQHFFARYTASRLLVVDTSAIDFVHSVRERELLLDRILAPVHGREYFAPLAEIA
jgi:deoxyguanosine kinase